MLVFNTASLTVCLSVCVLLSSSVAFAALHFLFYFVLSLTSSHCVIFFSTCVWLSDCSHLCSPHLHVYLLPVCLCQAVVLSALCKPLWSAGELCTCFLLVLIEFGAVIPVVSRRSRSRIYGFVTQKLLHLGSHTSQLQQSLKQSQRQ